VNREFLTSIQIKINSALPYAVIFIAFIAFMIPVFWIVTTSFKRPKDIMTMPPTLIFEPTLNNYSVALLGKEDLSVTAGHTVSVEFPKAIFNTAVISVGSTILALLLGIPAAYALARFNFHGKNFVAYFTLSIRMLPIIGLIIPFYLLFSRLHLLDKHIGLIIAYQTLNLSYVIWMMKSFFGELPRELEDAATVDGCTRLGAFTRIILPLSLPGLGATSIFSILICWNEFMLPLILAGTNVKVITVGIYSFIGFKEIAWGPLTAAATIVTLPMLIMILFVQRSLVSGLAMGATKG